MNGGRDVVRSWSRQHTDGWRAIVHGYSDGTFSTRTEGPIRGSAVTSRHRTFVAALSAADRTVESASHTCTSACQPWRESLAPKT